MAGADDEEAVGGAGADEEDDCSEGEGAPSGTAPQRKKRRRPKKKGAAGGVTGEGAAAEAEAEAEAPAPAPAPPSAPEAPGDESAEDGEEPDGTDKPGTGAGKKKKKSKKKGQAAAPVEEEVAEAAVVPDPTPAPPEPAADAGEDAGGGESGEEDEDEAGGAAGAGKKKRRRPKKKGGGAAGGAGALAVRGAAPREDDEAFGKWCQAALEASANGTETMSAQDLLRPPKAFWGYTFTGPLRPAYVTPQRKMPEGWLMPDYALDPGGVSPCERAGLREVPILEGKDLETMREACRLGREVLDIAARFMRPGVTGDQIDRVVHQACLDRKIYPSPLNYYRFPKSVCVSANEVICHGIPDCRPIEEGDIVNLDVSVYHQGYHADLNETYFIGQCDEDSHRLVRTAYLALHAAAKLIKPGTFYRDLGNAIGAEATKHNCAVVTTYCGHGVGQLFHGPPKVPHYRKNKAVGVMKPGHVFTVEPMINLGSNGGDRTWPDDWTAVTKDGKRSAQFEHTFLVTEQGVEVLTRRVGTDPSCMPQFDPAMFQL